MEVILNNDCLTALIAHFNIHAQTSSDQSRGCRQFRFLNFLKNRCVNNFSSLFVSTMTSLRTCAECNNILYPREDPDNKRLLYACRHCDYSEIASQPLVYRNDLQRAAAETAGVTTDVASDPTLVHYLFSSAF